MAIVVALRLPDRGVGDASPTPSRSASEGATPSEVASPTPTGGAPITGGPAPAGELLLRFEETCDVIPPIVVPRLTVLEDGRAIWTPPATEFAPVGYVIKRLNAAGLDAVRERIVETGLFETSAFYALERRPGAEPPGHGFCAYEFTWSDGGGDPVVVGSIQWLGAQEEAAYYQPAPERQALDALAQQLTDPEAWLDESAWSDGEAVPYQPTDYIVLAAVMFPQAATLGAPDFDSVSWPFDQPPDAFGEPYEGYSPSRCGIASPDAIETFAEELAAAGLEQFAGPLDGAHVTLPWAARGAAVEVIVSPRMPDGWPTCQVETP